MDSLVLGLQLILAVVFLTAGVAKLLDQQGSRRALAGFRVPPRIVPVAAFLLPLAELATAAALVAHPTARWGALAALVMLLGFIGGIAGAMARGEAPDCHCFGQIHSAPAGRSTLARNAALALLAAVVAIDGPGQALDDWVAARTGAELAATGAGILATLLAALCLRLWLDNRSLRQDLVREKAASSVFPPGLPLGATAPAFALPDTQGEVVSLDALLARGQPVALVFVSPGCTACGTLIPELGRWQATLAGRLTIGVISTGSVQENQESSRHGSMNVLLQENFEVLEAYRLRATPSAVIVGADGRIASEAVSGGPAVEPLIRLTLRGGIPTSAAEAPSGNGAGGDHGPLSVWRSA